MRCTCTQRKHNARASLTTETAQSKPMQEHKGGTGSTSLPSRRRAEAMTGLMFAKLRAGHV